MIDARIFSFGHMMKVFVKHDQTHTTFKSMKTLASGNRKQTHRLCQTNSCHDRDHLARQKMGAG